MSITHEWNGTVLTITSDSGSSSADLKGAKGDTGARGARGLPGAMGGGAAIEDNVISTETTWSSSGIMDRFAEHMSINANPAVCNPIPNMPLQVITSYDVKQEGSGTVSPTNIRPIRGMDAIKLVRCGKNIFNPNRNPDKDNYANATTINNGLRITIETDGTHRLCRYYIHNLVLKKGDIYTLSAVAKVSANNTSAIMLGVYDKDGNSISSIKMIQGTGKLNTSFTITDEYVADGNILGVVLYANVNGTGIAGNYAEFTNIQLECGSNSTAYEPYKGDTIIYSLGGKFYQGELDWATGVLTVNYKCEEYNGKETGWMFVNKGDNTSYIYRVVGAYGCLAEGSENQLSSHYPYSVITSTNTNTNCFYCYNSASMNEARLNIRVNHISIASKEDWMAYLAEQSAAGKPLQVLYKLSEPQTLQLTSQEVRAISGENIIYTDADEITVIGRVDTMYQLSLLADRVAALEARLGGE